MTAEEILHSHLESWGERELYLITEEEFAVLLDKAEKIEILKHQNADGTFYSELVFQGKRFASSS